MRLFLLLIGLVLAADLNGATTPSAPSSTSPTLGSGSATAAATSAAGLGSAAPTRSTIAAALERYELSAAAAQINRLSNASDHQYLTGRWHLAHYRYAAAETAAQSCMAAARTTAERSRCLELSGESLALRIVMISGDWERIRLARKVRDYLQQAIAADATNDRAYVLLARFYRIAPWLLGGSHTQASVQIDRAVALVPNNEAKVRGIDAIDAQEWQRAEQWLAQDKSPIASYYRAVALIELNQAAAAIALLKPLTQSVPEFFDAQFMLGRGAFDLEPQTALVALQQFVHAAPDAGAKRLANAWYLIGQLHERANRPNEALKAYDAALKAKSGHNESRKAYDRLRKSKSLH